MREEFRGFWSASLSLLMLHLVTGRHEDLARTPPMGWLSWTRFLCHVNCNEHPDTCIREQLFTEMAEILASEGYLQAGYSRVNIDDCWALKRRDARSGRLLPDPQRFPSGIPKLAEKYHDLGLQLGIYSNYGAKTCMGFAGTEMKDMKTDATTFAEWGVDMLKLDGCFRQPTDFHIAYPKMSAALNATGRSIVFSCSWPYYVRIIAHKEPDYGLISQHCHLWRNYHDIQINWPSIAGIIAFYETHQDELAKWHGPGHWNDPDMLVVGNPGITLDQAKAQMAFWCLWSAPLLMSNDLRAMEPGTKDILLNPRLIAINQDPLGRLGKLIRSSNGISFYAKPITPTRTGADGRRRYSYAVLVHNKNEKEEAGVTFTLADFGIQEGRRFLVTDVFSGHHLGLMDTHMSLKTVLAPCGVAMYKAEMVEREKGSSDRVWPLCGLALAAVLLIWRRRRCHSAVRRVIGMR